MIRMIVTDLDGTLLAGKSNLPEKNIAALKRAMDSGVKVVIASGRMIEATMPIAEKIGVNAPMVVLNGAMVYDPEADRILAGTTIPCETAVSLLREFEKRGAYMQAFPGRGFYLEKANQWTAYYSDKIGVTGIETGTALSRWLKTDVYKLLCLGAKEETDALVRELSPMYPEISFVKSGDTHLEIIMKGVDKGTGLQHITEITGIGGDEMMAFGDEENDLPILRYAKYGYAMENCAECVRREIKTLAPKNTDCGVARIVNLFLDEKRMGGNISE